MRAPLLAALLCLSAAAPLNADMVTLRSNETYYGTIIRFTDDKLTIRAEFPKKVQKDLVIDRAQLASIEFNDEKFNTDDPPAALGAHQGTSAATGSSDTRPKDTVVFQEGQNKPCAGIAIDEKTIKCGDSVYERSEGAVWRIYFGRP
jgi:hypothetical protein